MEVLKCGEMKKYNFSYKNQGGVDFTPDTYDFVHFRAIPSDDGNNLYGMTDVTKSTLIRNAELNPDNSDYRNMEMFDFEECLANNFGNHLVPLLKLIERTLQDKHFQLVKAFRNY